MQKQVLIEIWNTWKDLPQRHWIANVTVYFNLIMDHHIPIDKQ